MCVVYLLQDGTKGCKNGERLVVEGKDTKNISVPLSEIESVVLSKHAQITTQIIFELLKRKIPTFYVNRYGEVIGTLSGNESKLDLLHQQLSWSKDDCQSLVIAKKLIAQKINAQLDLIKQYGKRNKQPEIPKVIKELSIYYHVVDRVTTVDKLRGLEGIASKAYFSVFNDLISAQGWEWKGRFRHPSPDPVNALLSYGYCFLEREVRIALAGTGFDCRLGFMHSNNGRKDSLVYDIMELFRQKIVDRLVLTLVNKKSINLADFIVKDNKCLLTQEGRMKWLDAYETYMNKEVKEFKNKTPRQWIYSEVAKFSSFINDVSEVA